MDTLEELTSCLGLQAEIDTKTLELRKRYKAVIEAERERGNQHTIVVRIGGQMYALEREEEASRMHREAMAWARDLGGFYTYRLFKVGTVIE